MIFSVKSKTFLVGEYGVLFGGGAIVLLTEPEFQLIVHQDTNCNGSLEGIDEGSPAFLFFKQHQDVFQNLRLCFVDPHNGSGGFGASGAQYVLLHQLYRQLTCSSWDTDRFLDEYRGHCRQPVGPSGADCVAQQENQHIYFNSLDNRVERLTWNFDDLDFAIFKTGIKIKTHVHLRQLRPMDVADLNDITEKVRENFIEGNSALLPKNILDFFHLLDKKGLVIDETRHLVNQLLKIKGIRAAKGCGAMSADTIIVIFDKSDMVLESSDFLNLRDVMFRKSYKSHC
jgi:mevalonate kinase